MYSKKKVDYALELYHQCKSVTKTIRTLGYPSRRGLYEWINAEGKPKKQMHPRNPPIEIKMDALHRCFELGESIKLVSEDIGYTSSSIHSWRKKYLQRGMVALMNDKHIKPDTLEEGSVASDAEIEELKTKMLNMQLEIDILKETINVLKKDPGVDQTALRNREKAVIVDALNDKYSLPLLLKKLDLAKSCYYYQEKVLSKQDKYAQLRKRIKEIFKENKECYGYRRIYGLLVKESCTVSEKVVRRIMKQENLIVKIRKKRKYSSYKGEISPAVSNVIKRNFHATKPNQKWLTDITEFAIPAGKVYLSPIVDCFDGLLPCWTISTCPDSNLVNSMLDCAVAQLSNNEHPIVHSDRGCHYRWPGWIERMSKAGLTSQCGRRDVLQITQPVKVYLGD